jgi:hypothetical protein
VLGLSFKGERTNGLEAPHEDTPPTNLDYLGVATRQNPHTTHQDDLVEKSIPA